MQDIDKIADAYIKELNSRVELLRVKTFLYEKDKGAFTTNGLKVMCSAREFIENQNKFSNNKIVGE